jgi:flagellar basal body-associated protein FliL
MEFVARLADEDEAHLVKTGDFRLAYDRKYKGLAAELSERQFQISDIINDVLISKTSKDLSSQEGKEEMKREIINRINRLLKSGQIEDIYVQIIVQ